MRLSDSSDVRFTSVDELNDSFQMSVPKLDRHMANEQIESDYDAVIPSYDLQTHNYDAADFVQEFF